MIYKTIHTGSYDFGIQPVSLVDVHSRGVDSTWMQKRAMSFGSEIGAIQPEAGRTYLHLIAMGATEDYGANRNADGFRRQPLREYHNTFVKSGHVYKNHANKDPKKSSGIIKFSTFNEAMKRVDLIIGVDNDKWATELEKAANGEDIAFSMACKVPFDICKICENKAPTREDYCSHMKKFAGQILGDGRRVYVDNPNPDFFDISGVFRPADRIAFALQKVASAGILTGADLAALDGLMAPDFSMPPPARRSLMGWQKRALLTKLAAIEKEIEATAPGAPGTIMDLGGAFAPEMKGVSEQDVGTLSSCAGSRINKLMGALGNVRVSLPLRDFLQVVMGDEDQGVGAADVERQLPGIFSRILADGGEAETSDGTYDPIGGADGLPGGVQDVINKMIPGMSLAEGPAQKRITMVIVRKIPKPTLTPGSGIRNIKAATDGAGAELLAREYAKYKLSFLAYAMEKESSELLVRLGVLQNYLQV